MNQETEHEKKYREEFEKWSEDEENPNPYQTDMDYAEYGEACYIAACKKRQEEINGWIKIVNKNSEDLRDMLNDLGVYAKEIAHLKDLVERAKPWVEAYHRMRNHSDRFNGKDLEREQWLADYKKEIGG